MQIKTRLFPLIFVAFACTNTQKVADTQAEKSVDLPEIQVSASAQQEPYRAAETKTFDLIHTELELAFNWEKQHVLGKAKLKLSPHFYAQQTLTLDAKGFDIHEVAIINQNQKQALNFSYDTFELKIELDTVYTRRDTVSIFIDYTAKPNELEVGGSRAIAGDKGLYFINPLGEEADKPKQIWTQGETESNSRWFPTIDAPNQKTTQEFYLTVDTAYETLSNGELVFSTLNGDGTRTDNWVQTLPHAPYLAMLAIGDFHVAKEEWNGKPLWYMVEHEYAASAKEIFDHTPEMLTYFSDLLGVQYPWDKYAQVVVRDYVSGAMENTGAVIFGEFVQKTKRELLDDNNDGIVSHEMFHHWFGDLVTCESWSNLPLNESFATYGSVLWQEHKNGDYARDYANLNNMNSYFREAAVKKVDLIRFQYNYRDDMFDSHSYAKGSTILHMLRNYVGDEAFFESLKHYLTKHAYTAVEIHDLRLAFEEVTGEDLNWFFNQWFLAAGHPQLRVTKNYNDSSKLYELTIEQIQNVERFPLYKLPLAVDFYFNGKAIRKEIWVENEEETFTFSFSEAPDWVNVDAEKVLLAQIKETKSPYELLLQMQEGPLFRDKFDALQRARASEANDTISEIIALGLENDFHAIMLESLEAFELVSQKSQYKDKLYELSLNHENSEVRVMALRAYCSFFEAERTEAYFEKLLEDESYLVLGDALYQYTRFDVDKGLKKTRKAASDEALSLAAAKVFSRYGSVSDHAFFLQQASELSGYEKVRFFELYGNYLARIDDKETVEDGVQVLTEATKQTKIWWVRLYGINALSDIETQKAANLEAFEKKASALAEGEELNEVNARIGEQNNMIDAIQQAYKTLLEGEEDERIKAQLNSYISEE